MTIRKQVAIEKDGVIEIHDPAFYAGGQADVAVTMKETVAETPYDPVVRPIWEIAAEIAASVPDEEWTRVPTDLSVNLEHYLYGAPKEEEG